jgi:hypothetical protein
VLQPAAAAASDHSGCMSCVFFSVSAGILWYKRMWCLQCGGYAKDLAVLAERHMALHRAALRMWADHGL